MSINPPLKWAGGKRWLAPKIKELYKGEYYAEPFAGGLSIGLALAPEEAWINDINPHLITFYRHLRDGYTLKKYGNTEEIYYKCRARYQELCTRDLLENYDTRQEKSALFYYLNRHGFNGLYRENKKGSYNVSYGKYKKPLYELEDFTKIMGGWSLEFGSYNRSPSKMTDLCYRSESGSIDLLTFADPPYDQQFTGYSASGFNWDDQVECAEWLKGLPGKVITTNQATQRIIDLYKKLGFKIELLEAPRRISCDGNRTPVQEMFATRGFKS